MQENDEKYVQFPLSLLPDIISKKEETIEKIIHYGIYRFSTTRIYDIQVSTKQFLYCYYREKDSLTEYLIETIESYISNETLLLDEDYNGFRGKKFDPTFEIEQLEKIFEKDLCFKNKILEFYQIYIACVYFEVEKNCQNYLMVGKEMQNQVKQNEPILSVKIKLLLDFKNNYKSEDELLVLVGYLAIRSILGERQYVVTNKKHILSRMMGLASSTFPSQTFDDNISAIYSRFIKRHHIDKLIKTLELDWYIATYARNTRGMYISMVNKVPIEKLAMIAEERKIKTRTKKLKQSKIDAETKARYTKKLLNEQDENAVLF